MEAEKELALPVVGSGDKIHSGLVGGRDGRGDCDVGLGCATRSHHDDNGAVSGWGSRPGKAWRSEFEVLIAA